MTTPTRTEGDRYLDNCGRTWTVDEHGGLAHEAPGGVLRRSWHSLDACAGPLFQLPADHGTPTPGDKYRDRDGDLWTMREDGRLAWDETAESKYGLTETFYDFVAEYGPITKIEPVNEPATFRPLPLFTDAQRDAIGVAFDRTFPPSDGDASCPEYYLFPGGIQAKDIARHLTGNAAQAVQYLARSSRLDGVRKDDPVADLLKARDMIDDELARLDAAARHRDAA